MYPVNYGLRNHEFQGDGGFRNLSLRRVMQAVSWPQVGLVRRSNTLHKVARNEHDSINTYRAAMGRGMYTFYSLLLSYSRLRVVANLVLMWSDW